MHAHAHTHTRTHIRTHAHTYAQFSFVDFNQGTLTFINGDKYEGYWKNNEPDGQGQLTIVFPPLSYDGSFVNGKVYI